MEKNVLEGGEEEIIHGDDEVCIGAKMYVSHVRIICTMGNGIL